jgi:hypothetical protein
MMTWYVRIIDLILKALLRRSLHKQMIIRTIRKMSISNVCALRDSGITFISTLKVQRMESQIILKVLGARKPKGLNRIGKNRLRSYM